MVWAAIAYNTRSLLVLVRAIMTAQRYVRDILQPHVLPVMQRLPGAIFQQDNARPHTARVSQDCLRTDTTLPWASRSSDFSPIERIWDNLGCSFKLVGCPTHRPKLSQIGSIGEKSGDRAGQGRVVSVRRQSCDTLAV
ncbi:transposable element Tcb2 transposase [Trichonephila clavipes]|nr:transposable element Tcb2 transposase [Trichonephila clavipes]